jgi:hypothetical protein
MTGRVSGEVVLGLAEGGEDVAADCRNAAKLCTASRRPSGALEESAEVIMLCSATETAIGTRRSRRTGHYMSARRRLTLQIKGRDVAARFVQVLRAGRNDSVCCR